MRVKKSAGVNKAPLLPLQGDLMALIVPSNETAQNKNSLIQLYTWAKASSFKTAVVISGHRGDAFDRIAVYNEDHYQLQDLKIPINGRIREELCDEEDDIFLDKQGYLGNAAIDLHLQKLLDLNHPMDVVPVVLGNERLEFAEELGGAVGEVMYGHQVILVAAADVEALDVSMQGVFIGCLETMQVNKLIVLLQSEQVKVIGKSAFIAALLAAYKRGANRAQILQSSNGRFLGAALYRN